MNISVDNLIVHLGGDRILDQVSATVEPGEFVGVVGPNGAGKTTLLRTILGANEPTDGRVILGDDLVTTLSSRATSRRVAAVPQRTDISFEFTVQEVVGMGRHPHTPRMGSDPNPGIVEEAMERTAVEHLADRSVDAISGGERQRVLVARALAQDAPGVLLDEPTASLDVNHQVRTLDLVADLAAAGRSVLAAIHDLNLAARYCDRLLLLADGEIVARGNPVDVLTANTIEAAFGTRAIVREDPITGSPVVTAVPDRRQDRETRVHVIGGGGTAARAIALLTEAGFTVTTGVVPAGDTVTDVSTALDIEAVESPPFSAPDEAMIQQGQQLVDAAAVTVIVPGPTVESPVNQNLRTAATNPVVLDTETDSLDDGDRVLTTGFDDLITTVIAAQGEQPVAAESPPTD